MLSFPRLHCFLSLETIRTGSAYSGSSPGTGLVFPLGQGASAPLTTAGPPLLPHRFTSTCEHDMSHSFDEAWSRFVPRSCSVARHERLAQAPGRQASGWKSCFVALRAFPDSCAALSASGSRGGASAGAPTGGEPAPAPPPPRARLASVSCRTKASLLGPLCRPRCSACVR